MVRTCFQISFTNDFVYQKVKLNGILRYLKNEIPFICDDDLFDLRVIYNELIYNAVIHGNKNHRDKKVELYIEAGDNFVQSVIRDEGEGFDYISVSKNARAAAERGYKLDHGRGLLLVMELADCVKWNDSGNEVMFLKKINGKY